MIQGAAVTDQPHSRTPDEMAIARAIGDFTEHQAGIPPRLKALAVNAVGPALQARGEWLRLTTRQAVAVAVLVAVKADLEAGTSGLPDVAGQCPACLRSGLFLGDGGYVTCPQTDCPDPTAADQLLHGHPQAAIEAKAADCAEAATISRVTERRTAYQARAAGLREALQILGRTTPDNSVASSDTADNPPAHDGPTVAELAANDRNWDVEKGGE